MLSTNNPETVQLSSEFSNAISGTYSYPGDLDLMSGWLHHEEIYPNVSWAPGTTFKFAQNPKIKYREATVTSPKAGPKLLCFHDSMLVGGFGMAFFSYAFPNSEYIWNNKIPLDEFRVAFHDNTPDCVLFEIAERDLLIFKPQIQKSDNHYWNYYLVTHTPAGILPMSSPTLLGTDKLFSDGSSFSIDSLNGMVSLEFHSTRLTAGHRYLLRLHATSDDAVQMILYPSYSAQRGEYSARSSSPAFLQGDDFYYVPITPVTNTQYMRVDFEANNGRRLMVRDMALLEFTQ